MDDLELHDDDIPEFEFPHLRENRRERYNKARSLLEEYVDGAASYRQTFIEIVELPETYNEYGD